MAQFRIKIAGHTTEVTSLFDSTRDYCRNYLTEDSPELYIPVSREDLAREQVELDAEALREGLRRRVFTEPFLERTVIQKKLAEHLLSRDILLLHGSAVAVDSQGYLFMAKCGTGKSTHTRLWRQAFGERAVMVNDDKPFVEIAASGAVLHGAPWSGKHGLDTNLAVPLKGICLLQRGTENRIWRIPAEDAVPMLWESCQMPEDGQNSHVQKLVRALAANTALYRMTCTKDPQAAVVSYETMSGV